MKNMQRKQQGFSMVAAIFLLVVLAALGAFMVTFSNTQQLTSAQDVQGSRAYWAARGGLEWGVGSVLATTSCPAPSSTFTLDGFSLTVICSVTTHNEGGVGKNEFQVTSTAVAGGNVGGIGRVERSLTAMVEG